MADGEEGAEESLAILGSTWMWEYDRAKAVNMWQRGQELLRNAGKI
jgi:hypothetical protein